jgi:hypothetical protein
MRPLGRKGIALPHSRRRSRIQRQRRPLIWTAVRLGAPFGQGKPSPYKPGSFAAPWPLGATPRKEHKPQTLRKRVCATPLEARGRRGSGMFC